MSDDLISRTAAVDEIELGITYAKVINIETGEATELFKASNTELRKAIDRIKALPAAQPPLEEFEWCTDCKEYDQKAHCCHRFTKVIRRTVEELNVVRCKDCKWFGDIGCAMQIVDDSDRPSEYDFCSFAERKDNG